MTFKYLDPEVGFTSDVIRDPRRFVGRADLIQDSIAALNSPQGLLAIYGKRGVGKSSLMRQIQALATGNYELVRRAGLAHLIPSRPRRYYTVYYACDYDTLMIFPAQIMPAVSGRPNGFCFAQIMHDLSDRRQRSCGDIGHRRRRWCGGSPSQV
jgi:hypothetical protein